MKNISKILLDIKAVALSPDEPFTWASGIKSPIYCDNRLILSYPEERKIVEDSLTNHIKEEYEDVEYIMGTATAGIPHAALIAERLNLPMGFVRSSKKDHGKQNKIEGKIVKGAKVVVIEDLFSTGGSSIDVAIALEEVGFEVLGIVSIFTYNLPEAHENFKKHNLKYSSLTNYEELTEYAKEINYIDDKQLNKLSKWRVNPNDSSWMSL
ncbi:orotate phosphoribosyltransferase [Peptoniphilus stercorisuis]|uniref:Orotate phosphoribosyltransferase n=1 Tax=Peptoniphilus stercorisuis TaxID=1436965 RepID=A0ABS4KA61_9FIRM|nr:orotate phosphoribosyltransferase [Peptoniphilus stercorisuis]MBP2024665.1 orotate phosphoribosyltransferase [Peptoniphilus stercorisuis]